MNECGPAPIPGPSTAHPSGLSFYSKPSVPLLRVFHFPFSPDEEEHHPSLLLLPKDPNSVTKFSIS